MLEPGHAITDCTVIRQLATFDSRLEYLVKTVSGEEKLVQFSGSPNWSQAQRQAFHDQIKALCALNIPAVGVPTRAIEQEGELFCLYPLSSGVPLQDTLADERAVRTVLELTCGLTALLEPAHQQQLFHGALSPHTVYLDKGQPVLADFSLASLVAFDYRTVVEAEYASPEQIRGEVPGTAADVYSLGCLFYALLMGRPPFSGGDAFTVGMQHLNDSFPVLPESLAFCAELLHGMTAKVSSERVSLTQVRSQLESLLSLEDLDQIPVRAAGAPSTPDQKHKMQQDAMVMVARIEDQLRAIESAAADKAATKAQPIEQELSLSPAGRASKKLSPTRRLIPLLVGLVGLVVGFCLGTLFFDFYLARPEATLTPTVFSVDSVPPDYTNSTQLLLEGDLAGAERELRRLLANFPDHPQIYNNLAAAAAVRGDIEAAREWLEQAIALDTQTATIYRNLGSVYAEIARDSYGRALPFDYVQIPLQLDIFANQGVLSWPLGADTLVAPVSPSAVEEATLEESVRSSPLLSEGELAAMASVTAEIFSTDSAINLKKAESATTHVEISNDPIVEQQAAEAELAPPVPGNTEAGSDPQEDPVRFLERWAATWSAQDVEAYLGFYSNDFIPAGGLDYAEWIRQRRERLQRPEEFLVTLSAIELRGEVDGLVQLEAIQDYRSGRYFDRILRLFDLYPQDGSWKIARERSLELIYLYHFHPPQGQ